MTSLNSLQLNQPLQEKDRLDINPNAPLQYIPRDDKTEPQKFHVLNQTDPERHAVGRRVRLTLRELGSKDRLNFIPNTAIRNYKIGRDAGSEAVEGEPMFISSSAPGIGGVGEAPEAEAAALAAAAELLPQAEAVADELLGQDWTRTDSSGYRYIDPAFYVGLERLTALFNMLQLIGVVIDSIKKVKEVIINLILPKASRGARDKTSASEALGMARESGMSRAQGQVQTMTDDVIGFNQDLLQSRLLEAEKNAGADGWSYVADVLSSGGAQAVQRQRDAHYAEAAHGLISKYEDFMKRTQQRYEDTLGKARLYHDGLTQLGEIYENFTWDNLVVDIGGRKVDINRDKLLASHMALTSMENFRQAYYMFLQALKDLKNIVIEGKFGLGLNSQAKQAIVQMLEGLKSFESMVFQTFAYQLQSVVAAHNQEVDAYDQWKLAEGLYQSAAGFGWAPLLGGLIKNISDWGFLEAYYANTDDVTSPTVLDMSHVYSMLAEMLGVSEDQLRRELALAEGNEDYTVYITRINDYEAREWELIGQLNEAGVTLYAADGFQEINEARVNGLRESLLQIQRNEHGLLLVIQGLIKLSKIVVKLKTGIGDIDVGEEAISAMKAGLESRRLAFDLKFAGIKNKVDNFNKQLQQQKTLEKSRAVAIGSFFGMAIAVILMVAGVYAPPLWILAVTFTAAMGQLGAALGSIIYNAANPADDKIYERTDFYVEQSKDNIEQMYNTQIDKLDEADHIDAEDSDDPFSAGNQWARNTEEFMRVRAQLTKIYFMEKLLMMYEKALSDLKSLAATPLTGMYTGDNLDSAQEVSRNRFEQKLQAYGLKKEMVDDIISRRNVKVAQTKELNWAIFNACLAVVKIVFSSIGEATTGPISEVSENVGWGASLASLAAQAAKAGLEANSGYGKLDNLSGIEKIIDDMVANGLDEESSNSLRRAFAGINSEDMLTSTGGGRVEADGESYYAGIKTVQQMYNRVIAALRLAEALGRLKAKISKGPTAIGMSDAFTEDKANVMEQLDLLYERVQVYVERTNQMADAYRQLWITLVFIALEILMKVLKETDVWQDLKDKITQELGDCSVEFIEDKETADLVGKIFGGETWDGTVGVDDFVNMVLEMVVSKQSWQTLSNFAINNTFSNGKEASTSNDDKAKDASQASTVSGKQSALSSEDGGLFAAMQQQEDRTYASNFHAADVSIWTAIDKMGDMFYGQYFEILNIKLQELTNGLMNSQDQKQVDKLMGDMEDVYGGEIAKDMREEFAAAGLEAVKRGKEKDPLSSEKVAYSISADTNAAGELIKPEVVTITCGAPPLDHFDQASTTDVPPLPPGSST